MCTQADGFKVVTWRKLVDKNSVCKSALVFLVDSWASWFKKNDHRKQITCVSCGVVKCESEEIVLGLVKQYLTVWKGRAELSVSVRRLIFDLVSVNRQSGQKGQKIVLFLSFQNLSLAQKLLKNKQISK